jgi:hypothetical protein
MPTDQSKDPIVAATTSDWHLWPRAPLFRSSETNWLEVQANYLHQLYDVLPKPPSAVPLIFAGDLADKADPSSSFLSWCWDHIPECYVIAGNHDLPHHRLQDLDKSILGALIKLGRCKLLQPETPTYFFESNLYAYGFSWGQDVQPPKNKSKDAIHLAVVHAYIWTKKTGYPGAPEEKRLGSWQDKLKDYSCAVFGDNHKGFLSEKDGCCSVLNHGTMMIRKSDEHNHKPCVGLIHQSGKITRHYLDTSKDKYIEVDELKNILDSESSIDTDAFLKELEALGDKGLDYVASVKRWCENNKISEKAYKLVLEILHH